MGRRVVWSAAVCVLFTASGASAAAFHVQARTESQAYQLRAYRGTDPLDPVLLPRRRIVQYLGLDAFELVTGEDLGFETSLRIFSDFGLSRGEADKVDGLRTEDADLMYANVRWKKGGFQGTAGRQYFVDAADIFSFDGVRARYLHSLGVGAEAYAGLWVKGASFLGSSNYQLEGIREGEGSLPTDQYGVDPFLSEETGIEPVFGARLLGENVAASGVSGGLGYRRSLLGGRINSERLGMELRYGTGKDGINAMAVGDYDLLVSRFAAFRVLGRYDADTWAAQVEALRTQPSFSSYSIWYYFATAPRDEVRLRGDLTPIGPFRYYVQALATNYGTALNSSSGLAAVANDAPFSLTWGAGGGAQYLSKQFHSGLDVTWRNGWGGRQLWVDLNGGYVAQDQRWSVDVRGSYASVKDMLNPLLRGDFYGAQVWGSYLLSPGARASLVVEENVNPFTRNDTKVFFVFDLKAVL